MTESPGRPTTALTIAGSDSSGGAGAQADLKTFLANRVHGLTALTAVTVQNSLGVRAVHEVPPEVVAAQIVALTDDIGVDATKTGMLASAATIEAIVDTVRRVDVGPLVVDPVSASQHGDPLLHPDALDALRTALIPLATIITPNLDEVRLLVEVDVRSRDGLADAARALHDLGPQWVLVKGGRLPAHEDAVDVLFDGTTFTEFTAPRTPTTNLHGSGDALGATITAALAGGATVPDAVARGKRFATAAVAASYPLGAGHGPVSQFWRIRD